MDPYTPRVRTGAKKKHIGLSAKEYDKIHGTLASVRRQRQTLGQVDDDLDLNHRGSRDTKQNSYQDSSFLAETSFVRAPLNSRVVSNNHLPKEKGKAKQEPLDRLPLEIQEALILEDLLFVLQGIEGTHVTFHPDYSPEDDDPLQGVRFVASQSLDSSLSDLVVRILPLGTYYTAIFAFVEQRSHLDFGLVNHALCAAIREMLRDYQTLLSQLEHAFNHSPSFSLQKLWFYVHPTVHTLSLIYHLILEIATADDVSNGLDSSSEASSSEDEEEKARNAALGLGGAKFKAVLSEMKQNDGLGGIDPSSIAVKGGEVLTILYERMQNMNGDPTANAVYGTLLKKAGKPYIEMLRDWVASGRLVDPYEELLVKESKFIDRGILEMDYTDEYWEKRYTLRDGSISANSSKRHQAGVPFPRTPGGRLPGGACIPPLLDPWKHKILLAGKYLNVIRECGIETKQDYGQDYDPDLGMEDENFYKFIEDAYSYANRTLLELLLKDQQLVPRLRSLKRFFFLSQSFFLNHLLELASTELRKPPKSASVQKLQSLLDLALNTDVQGDDVQFRDDLKVTMADTGLFEFLDKIIGVSGVINKAEEGEPHEEKKDKEKKDPQYAIDTMTFDYSVNFPLSLVISRKTILRYQLIFRFLLHLKYIEQALSHMWIDQMTAPWKCSVSANGTNAAHIADFNNWRLRVCLLRARMLAFVQQILAFLAFEVLEPNWGRLEKKLAKVTTVDQLLRDHVDFLDTCLKEAMLTSSKLLKATQRLVIVCQMFAFYTGPLTKKTHETVLAATGSDELDQPKSKLKRWEVLAKFEKNFNHWFGIHLDCVQFYASSDNVALLPLVIRLTGVKTM